MGKITYTTRDRDVVNLLKTNPNGLTMAQIAATLNIELESGHMVSMVKRGLIEVIGDAETERVANSLVTVYHFETVAELKRADGKVNNYTAGEKSLLAVAMQIEGNFTLADLAAAMGKEKLSSGSINGLVRKGNITKLPEKIKRPTKVKKSVNVYGFKTDIPADATIVDVIAKNAE